VNSAKGSAGDPERGEEDAGGVSRDPEDGVLRCRGCALETSTLATAVVAVATNCLRAARAAVRISFAATVKDVSNQVVGVLRGDVTNPTDLGKSPGARVSSPPDASALVHYNSLEGRCAANCVPASSSVFQESSFGQ
jgi:hypothetical protein